MPNIIDKSYFQKANDLNIPLSIEMIVANPTIETPNSVDYLTSLCEKVEKSILVNSLGLEAYNELQLAIADDFVNPLYAKYEKLVKGEQYNGKIWYGLNYEYSLIAWRIFEQFLTKTNQKLTAIGNVEVTPQNANLTTPAYIISNANDEFIRGYQGGILRYPVVYNDGEFIDYFGNSDEIEVSLYQYLSDKASDFTNVDLNKFKIYETVNSFGI